MESSVIYYTLLSGYCHRKNEGGVPGKNWTTGMSGMYLFIYLNFVILTYYIHASQIFYWRFFYH